MAARYQSRDAHGILLRKVHAYSPRGSPMAEVAVQLRIRLLGTPEVQVAGTPLILQHQKARALLYYLAATGSVHTRDHLATLLWSESPESNARHSLRSSLYHIRQALHVKGAEETLVGAGDLVYLRLEHDACDIALFRRLLAESSEQATAEAASLYRGPLLQDYTLTDAPLFEEWARFEASVLRQAYLGALQRLATWAERRQAYSEAISYVQRMVQLDSLAEESQQRLIRLYMYTGAVGQALRQYQQFETELRQELGLTPSSETQTLVSMAVESRRNAAPQFRAHEHMATSTSQAQPFARRDDLLQRLTNLPSHARYLLDVMAVADQPLPFELLHAFPGIQGDQLSATIEELVARGLLRETTKDTFALVHRLLREALLRHLSHLRRQAIHRQLAIILEACPALQQYFPLRQIALHAVIGEDIERARRYGLQVLDELARDKASAETADLLHHLHDLLAQTASTHEMLRLTSALGQVYQSLGQLEQAAFWHQRHFELAHKSADPPAQSAAHLELGELALVANDYQAAASAGRAGLAIDIPSEDPQRMALVARGHRLLGAALAMEGSNLAAAEGHLQQAVAAHRLTDNMSDLSATLFELGNVAAQRGELKRALEFYAEAAHTAEGANAHYFLALAHNNYAYHSLLLGQLEAAKGALTKGRQLAETYEMSNALLHLYSTQGEIHLYLGEWPAASEAFQRGLSLAEELGNLERQAGYRAGLALAARGQDNLEAAITLLEEALTLITERGYCHLWTRIQLWLAETLLLCGHGDEAELHLNAALEMAHANGRTLLLLQGERLHARLLADRNDWPAADTLFTRTLDRASSLGLSLESGRTKAAWGETALLHAQTPHNGYALLAEARKILAAHDARAELNALMVALRH
jgi:DNA-binding SARP family transcriptional activator